MAYYQLKSENRSLPPCLSACLGQIELRISISGLVRSNPEIIQPAPFSSPPPPPPLSGRNEESDKREETLKKSPEKKEKEAAYTNDAPVANSNSPLTTTTSDREIGAAAF